MIIMFKGATTFNKPFRHLDHLEFRDYVLQVQGATKFIRSLANWTTSRLTNMIIMFKGATTFNQPFSHLDHFEFLDYVFQVQGAASSINRLPIEPLRGSRT